MNARLPQVSDHESIRVHRDGRIVVHPPAGHGEAWRGDGSGRLTVEPVSQRAADAIADLVLLDGTLRGFA